MEQPEVITSQPKKNLRLLLLVTRTIMQNNPKKIHAEFQQTKLYIAILNFQIQQGLLEISEATFLFIKTLI